MHTHAVIRIEKIWRLSISLSVLLSGLLLNPCYGLEEFSISALLNNEIVLPCRLTDESTASVSWRSEKYGQLSQGTNMYKLDNVMAIIKPAPNEWNLLIKKVHRDFEGIYTCNADEVIVMRITLVIETPPKIDESASSPSQVNPQEYENVTVMCEASGTPTPVITWFRGSTENITEIGITGKKLIFPNITRYASDVYMCRATNVRGKVERRIHVSVKFPLEVKVMEADVFAAGGDMVAMSCVVQGSPLYESYWVKGLNTGGRGERLNSTEKYWKYIEIEEEAGDGIPMKFITLIIKKATISYHDYDNYTCVTKGEDDEAQASIQLRPK